MGILGTSNSTVLGAVQQQSDQQFKNVNNLLSLQDNHVEEFFQYHGEMFLAALEKLMEDVIERVVSQMLAKLSFDSTGTSIVVNRDALREYERIAKQQYLESQGFSGGMGGNPTAPSAGMAIAGLTGTTGQYQQMQGAVGNGSGYPIPPSGTDGYGRPYWIDAQGQMSYEPPSSGLHLGAGIQKAAAWAKWLM